MPRISVLMPTHNRADVVGYAIDSVLCQTQGDFELLIVGDGCTDETADVVAGYNDRRICWYDLPKSPYYGYANRNIALREAKGDLVAYAPHDDLLFPDHLERMENAIEEAGADWIYSRPLWVSTDGIIVPFCTNLNLADELDSFLNVRNTIPASCIVHRRSCFDKSGYWPEDVSTAGDWHFWVRIINDGKQTNYSYLPLPTCLHFSADWKKSRFALLGEVKTLLEIVDNSSWWPASLKYTIPKRKTEQEVLFQAMTKGGLDLCQKIRNDIETVIDRLAWENIQRTRPLCGDLADEVKQLKASRAEAEQQVAELRSELADEVKQLKASRAEAEQQVAELRSELDQVYKSRSWRLTGPLRKLKIKTGGGIL